MMLKDLPPVLTGEQVRNVLHISKRRCAWMLNNGFIQCQNSGKKTWKYAVLKEDLIAYIKDSEKHPEKYVTPYAQFSTGKHTKPYSRKRGFPPSLPDEFRKWIRREFYKYPDALTVPQVIKITGYTKNTVDRWMQQGHIKFVETQTTRIIPKQCLIDFYCSYGYTIVKMSDKHIKLMKKFFKQNGGK